MSGWLYVLHFNEPHKHARHYVGSTERLIGRLGEHASGNGARLTEVLVELDKGWSIGSIFQTKPGVSCREVEAIVKRRKHGPRLCRVCNPNGTAVVPPGCYEVESPNVKGNEP